jgi:hypothetical protein
LGVFSKIGKEMNRRSGDWRIVGGLSVLLILAVTTAYLTPVYLRNLELQRYLDQMTQQKESILERPDDWLRVAVVNEASRLGLPVQSGHVRIERADHRLRIEVLYTVEVNLPLYTVDLHFHPGAGSQ